MNVLIYLQIIGILNYFFMDLELPTGMRIFIYIYIEKVNKKVLYTYNRRREKYTYT